MIIEFENENDPMYEMLQAWNALEDAKRSPITMSHYELADGTGMSPQAWKAFLTHPRVADAINEEFILMQQAKMRYLIDNVDKDSKSVGLAQQFNAISSNLSRNESKEDSGPKFIYTFVPLNEQEQKSPNVVMLDHNPFVRK